MSEWKEVVIRDLGTVITGKTPSKNNPKDWGDEMPFITPSDYGSYGKVALTSKRKLSKDGIERFYDKVLPKNSVLVTCIGSDMGKIVMNGVEVVTNQQINSIVPDLDKITPDYLYYLLVSLYKTLRIYGGDGTAVPIVNKGNFEKIDAIIPIITEQKAIAEVLSSLDDKIDLLHRQNKTLEAMAETLFRQWFIEEADDEWELTNLGEVVEIYDNKRIPISKMEREKMKYGILYPYYGAATIMDYVNDYIFDGEYILLGEDGTVRTEEGYPVSMALKTGTKLAL
ncbi:MAG: restriction endonuclease subunit S [Candidatus Stygibacter australis]|nr:restriction endonuclease subunit S [Candidatus Stygibacter australis]